MKQINSLKQVVLSVAVMVAFCSHAFAQPMNGTYTIAGTSPDYSTLSAAISHLNSRGVSGPVVFNIRDGNYSGSSWQGSINNISGASATNRITFRSQSGNKANVTINVAGTSTDNFIVRFNNASFITFRDLTFINTNTSTGRIFDFITNSSNDSILNCTLTGASSTSSANTMALIYAAGHTGSNNVFYNNLLQNGGTTIYWWGSNTTTTSNGMQFIGNTINTTNGYYCLWSYYTRDMKFRNNTITRTGTSVYYINNVYYGQDNFEYTGNILNISSTTTTYSNLYYLNYSPTNSSATVVISNNQFNINNTTGLTYIYQRYMYNCQHANNVYNISSTTGGKIVDGLYYVYNSETYGNEVNFYSTSTGYANYYDMYYGFASESHDNKVTVYHAASTSAYANFYLLYFGGTTKMYDNEYAINNNTGYCYLYIGYTANGGEFRNNKVDVTTNSGIIYGVRPQYGGCNMMNNTFNLQSNTGTVYGLYPSYMNAGHIFNNTFNLSSAGVLYSLYSNYSTGGTIANNTFHNNGTGTNSYLMYTYNTSIGTMKIQNNIFSRNVASSNMVYHYNARNSDIDYNLYSTPGNLRFQNVIPSVTATNLHSWREDSWQDNNSLVYDVPYVNAASGDFRINPSSPAAWAVNGRGIHDTARGMDIAGTSRARVPADGVPDLGAYEVTPTSTPPNATAIPANPVANGTQVFIFAQDTVATIDWGATVPATYTMRQYSGVQAAPLPAGVGRMYFYAAGTPDTWVHSYKPKINYKDIWLGTIPTESEAVIARSSNGGAWEGYNYTNAATNTTLNILSPAANFDSVGSFTGVQNGRIGIRCVENPKGLAITNITAFVADIDWQAVFNPIGYQVIVKTNSKAPTSAEWNSSSFAPTNSLAAGGIAEDTKYFVFIRSICGVKDTSGYSVDSFETLITCHKPDITLSDINDNRVVVSWKTIKTATKYEYVMTKSPAPPTFGTDINKTSVLAPFLDDGTEYFIHVRAHCNSIYDKSDWSSVSFSTWKTGVSNVSLSGNSMNVYPNPVRNEMVVTIGGTSTESGTISLLDMTGKVLKTQTVTGNKVTINVTELPSGMYMAQYTSDTRREQVKFYKE